MVLGAVFALVGSFGLAKLGDFYKRCWLHVDWVDPVLQYIQSQP
jgi:hypothetical protein